jgi:tetratricopeptide (TPR) repeat protein
MNSKPERGAMRYQVAIHPFLRGFLALLCLTPFVAPALAQTPGRPAPKTTPRAAQTGTFEQLVARATEAREAGRTDEAIAMYRQCVKARPSWDEGWWYLATLLYDGDQYDEAAQAFATAAKLKPHVGTTWIMLGLCEYKLGRYDDAANHLVQGQKLGFGQNDAIARVATYHMGILGVYKGEFEPAQKRLEEVAYSGSRSDNLILALGLAVLRIPMLPDRIAPDYRDRDLIRQAGWAQWHAAQNNAQEAQREYDRLLADYPKTPGVNYAYGNFQFAQRNDEGAFQAFKRELEVSPNHGLARLQIAYTLMTRKENDEALEYAQEAARLIPNVPLAQFLLGRLNFEMGNNERAIASLEAARSLAPEEPRIYYVLSRAYDRAKRKEDAQRARETFTALSKKADEAARRTAPGQTPSQDPDSLPRP